MPSDEHITMLLGMGFIDVEDIKKALELAKNDLNEAVAILTGEVSKGDFNVHQDVEMKELQVNDTSNNNLPSPQFGPQLEATKAEDAIDITDDVPENIDVNIEEIPEEFPATNLYELEDRIFIENWSIPYKKDESLAKCLYGATKLAYLGKAEENEYCVKFLDRILPECCTKLLCSQAVKKWGSDVHEGVFNMIQLFVDLAAMRLKYQPIPLKILTSLAQAFDPDSELHFKNRSRKWDRSHYEDIFGYDKCPALSPPYNSYKEPFGWLVNLINRFAYKGGIDGIINQTDSLQKVTPSVYASLLKPLGLCAAYLNKDVVGYSLGGAADKVVCYIKELKADDMKEKEVDKVYDLLRTLHFICEALWPEKTSAINELHLNTILKMLNLPHFNAKMNALKELSKLIKEAEKERWSNIAHHDVILKWLLQNKVISIAFSSSLHHSQYCEKLKKIVEFAGPKISTEELTTIWSIQIGKHVTVVDNIHSIITSASQNFSSDQLEHMISLFQKSWNDEDDKSKERLLLLIGKIGREIRDKDIILKCLDMLWDVSHVDKVPLYLLNQAVQSHLDILTDSNVIKASVKTDYVAKCVHDIKQNTWVVPAIRHILNNLQSITKQPNVKNARVQIDELQNQHSLLKLLCQSLIHSHRTVTLSIPIDTLSGDTLINNMYTYAETVITHLKLIEFLLQEGGSYLHWSRCKEIWDCLMLDPQNCDGDYETCLEWFVQSITDLSAETQKDLFVSKILKTDIKKMKEVGFKCFKSYFESVNINEHKMRRNGPSIVVEKQELTGISYLWQLVLDSPYPTIAIKATQYLINVSHSYLSLKLKKSEVSSFHRKFIGECNKSLDGMLLLIKDDDSGPKDAKAAKTFKKPLPVKGAAFDRAAVLISIERLLNLCYKYIITVEENYVLPRSFPPHRNCFRGSSVDIHIKCESHKSEFNIISHSNEKMSKLRSKIAEKLCTQIEYLQIYKSDTLLAQSKDHKLLLQLEFEEKQALLVKVATIGVLASSSDKANVEEELPSPNNKPSTLLEKEKALPSFIMAVECKIFDKLYQLAALEEQNITSALKNLFLQLPTDGNVLEAIDVFSFQNPLSCSPGTRAGWTSSSKSVLENYFKCSAPNMSTFRVLYNLQVLSSKLMPVLGDDTTAVTHSFRENWLNAGGLSLIMNILLPDTLPSNADYELRQSCYYIILQLARFLLCGHDYDLKTSEPPLIRTYSHGTCGEYLTSANSSISMASQVDGAFADVSVSSTSTPIKVDVSPKQPLYRTSVASSWPGAKHEANESPETTFNLSSTPGSASSFTSDSAAFQRKRLRSASVLDSVSPTVKMVIENLNEEEYAETISSLVQVAWAAAAGQLQLNARYNHTDEEASVFSPGEKLKAGLCLRQESISSMDSILANNSLELLVMCLQLRPKLLHLFYQLPNVSEFVIDILTGSPSAQVRSCAALQFSMLGNSPDVENVSEPNLQHPKEFLIRTLLKAHLPYWTVAGTIRGITYKLLLQCQEYFDLMCSITYLLSSAQQKSYGIEATKFLEDELTFLTNSDDVNVELLCGHLKLINVLFTCQNVEKQKTGRHFIEFLLDDFLFYASKLVNYDNPLSNFGLIDVNMNAYDTNCRKEAFNLLLTLADRCSINLCQITTHLIKRNHTNLTSKEWNHQPSVSSRPANGFVGLKNAGATCYMNSVLQQLYMQPGVRESVLKVTDTQTKTSDYILYQVQTIFAHLLEGLSQFYAPESFWKSFKLWGEPVNTREQQDAFEFFTNITDQLDENLKSLKKEEIFKKTFCGMFVDQKICKDCTHTFERDEPFFSLPVTVKCGSLEASLEQFVHNEVMEGDNAYFCEKCCERRTTMKRTCIKTFPPVLVFQLKRFWYDWERNRAIKFDDYFSFPWVLDIEPFTQAGISKQETQNKSDIGISTEVKPVNIVTDNHQFYELVGVVVHSGQASAGHYYSFIKNRESTMGEFDKWYKFNDTTTEIFDMTNEALEIECFGGEYRVSQTDANNQYPETRIRNWNAYMLFYETMDKNKLPSSSRGQIFGDPLRSYPVSPASSTASSNPPSPGSNTNTVNQLSALIRKGDRKGLFTDNMPAGIKKTVNEENIEFWGNRDIYNEEYFSFVRQLCSINVGGSFVPMTDEERAKHVDAASLSCMELAIKFLINTYLRTGKSFRKDLDAWVTTVEYLLSSSAVSCSWFVHFFGSEDGKSYLVSYVIECPDKSIREAFSNLLFFASHYYMKHELEMVAMDKLITNLLSLLDREITQNIKQCFQFFHFFYRYSSISFKNMLHLCQNHCFQTFFNFLIGSQIKVNVDKRRWSTTQMQEFASLYKLIFTFIINSNIQSEQSVFTAAPAPFPRHLFQYDEKLDFFTDLREVVYATYGDIFLIEILLYKIEINNIHHLFHLLTECWSLNDDYQNNRIEYGIDGSSDDEIDGLFNVIQSSSEGNKDARRSYQCIKFLIGASNKLQPVRDFLIRHSAKWQWAVDWLKEKNTLAEATKLLTEIESDGKKKITNVSTGSMIMDTSAVIIEEEEALT